mmetsp:Transcript_37287/g.91791  ORF Transcript_37287/g.91791 Transcript_37287/m.91791 type:complete len:288 (+) Transcript_37287:228-1091(+)
MYGSVMRPQLGIVAIHPRSSLLPGVLLLLSGVGSSLLLTNPSRTFFFCFTTQNPPCSPISSTVLPLFHFSVRLYLFLFQVFPVPRRLLSAVDNLLSAVPPLPLIAVPARLAAVGSLPPLLPWTLASGSDVAGLPSSSRTDCVSRATSSSVRFEQSTRGLASWYFGSFHKRALSFPKLCGRMACVLRSLAGLRAASAAVPAVSAPPGRGSEGLCARTGGVDAGRSGGVWVGTLTSLSKVAPFQGIGPDATGLPLAYLTPAMVSILRFVVGRWSWRVSLLIERRCRFSP